MERTGSCGSGPRDRSSGPALMGPALMRPTLGEACFATRVFFSSVERSYTAHGRRLAYTPSLMVHGGYHAHGWCHPWPISSVLRSCAANHSVYVTGKCLGPPKALDASGTGPQCQWARPSVSVGQCHSGPRLRLAQLHVKCVTPPGYPYVRCAAAHCTAGAVLMDPMLTGPVFTGPQCQWASALAHQCHSASGRGAGCSSGT